MHPQLTTFENIVIKGKAAHTEQHLNFALICMVFNTTFNNFSVIMAFPGKVTSTTAYISWHQWVTCNAYPKVLGTKDGKPLLQSLKFLVWHSRILLSTYFNNITDNQILIIFIKLFHLHFLHSCFATYRLFLLVDKKQSPYILLLRHLCELHKSRNIF